MAGKTLNEKFALKPREETLVGRCEMYSTHTVSIVLF